MSGYCILVYRDFALTLMGPGRVSVHNGDSERQSHFGLGSATAIINNETSKNSIPNRLHIIKIHSFQCEVNKNLLETEMLLFPRIF